MPRLKDLKFYNVWKNMKARCYNKKNPSYKDYGGRGISVCEEWLQFINFEEDMYDEYGYWYELNHDKRNSECTLDRINNNGNYCKENCKWSTQKEQCNNKRQRVKK